MKKNKKIILIAGAFLSAMALSSVGTAYAIEMINVTIPVFPALGEATAVGCDTNGVGTTYTYGNSSSNGVKVTGITVSGIDAQCKNTMVEFLQSGVVVATYNSAVTNNASTMTTNIFTGQFNDVRVTLTP
jgi:hypothetical protein